MFCWEGVGWGVEVDYGLGKRDAYPVGTREAADKEALIPRIIVLQNIRWSYAGQIWLVQNAFPSGYTLSSGFDSVVRRWASMAFATALQRQARVCARLAEDCEDQHLAERLRAMAASLAAKADDMEELPSERLRQVKPLLAA